MGLHLRLAAGDISRKSHTARAGLCRRRHASGEDTHGLFKLCL